MATSGGDRIPTNMRAMLILEAVGRAREPMSAADIGRHVGLPKQTAHRLCNTLVDEGYLARDEGRGQLRPGRRSRELASAILFSSASPIARHQILQSVAREVGSNI